MSDWRLRWMALALVTVVAGVACDDNPVDEGIDEPARLSVNPTFAVVDAADTTTVTGFAVNEFGSPTLAAMQFSACDSKVEVTLDPDRVAIEPPDRALVIGRTLGSSCVNVDGPGELTATADINVVPAEIELAAPASEFRSGEAATVDVTYLDAAGNTAEGFDKAEVSFSTSDPAVAEISSDGTVSPKAPGDASVTATLLPAWGAERSGVFSFSVVPGAFQGSASATSGNSGQEVTYTAASGQEWDGDTEVVIGNRSGFILSQGPSELTTVIPWGVDAGAADVLFTRVGSGQLALETTFDVAAREVVDDREPNDDPGAAPPVTFPLDDVLAVDADDLNDFFAFTVTETTEFHMELHWDSSVNGDMDLLVDEAGLPFAFPCGFPTASTAIPEAGDCELPPGDYLLWVNNFAEAGLTNYRVIVTAN